MTTDALSDLVALNPEPKDEMMLSIDSSQCDSRANNDNTFLLQVADQERVIAGVTSPTEAFDSIYHEELNIVNAPNDKKKECKNTVSPNSTSSNVSVEYVDNQDIVLKHKKITSLTDFVSVAFENFPPIRCFINQYSGNQNQSQ